MTYKRLKRDVIYQCEWLNLYCDRVAIEHGEIIEKYHQLDFPKKSVAIIVLKGDMVCLIKSYRYSINKTSIEIPAGYVEPGEELTLAAQREVLEETGLHCTLPEFFFKYYPSNGISNQLINVFIAKADGEVITNPEHEGIQEVFWHPVKDLPNLLTSMDDGISMVALSRFFISNYS